MSDLNELTLQKTKKDYFLIKLFIGIALGIIIGMYSNEGIINVIQSIKYILNQVISFMVPLIVLGFIAPAITKMGDKASKMLGVILTKSEYFKNLLNELNDIMLFLVSKVVVPILPVYIGTTFATLSYEGAIIKRVPVFLIVILIVIIGHFIWLALLYSIAGIISKRNPLRILKHYGPAYLTAVGTMSSAATLPVALQCANKSDALDKDIVNFAIPMGATIHLCGSVLTETFFVMTISKLLYGSIPSVGTMILFCILLGIFAVGAPGVPGGTVVASLGIIISILGFDNDGTALVLAIFALQDSFGTACNITGDGAIALMLQGIFKKGQ